MNRKTLLALFCVLVSGVLAAPSPIDPNTAHVVALNSNVACSTGSCTPGNSSILETESADNTTSMYSSGATIRYNAWSTSSLAAIVVGSLALSL